MGVPDHRFIQGDVYIGYDHESVMFRYDFKTRKYFMKFYGDAHETEVPHEQRLLNDARLFGVEIDSGKYSANKPQG